MITSVDTLDINKEASNLYHSTKTLVGGSVDPSATSDIIIITRNKIITELSKEFSEYFGSFKQEKDMKMRLFNDIITRDPELKDYENIVRAHNLIKYNEKFILEDFMVKQGDSNFIKIMKVLNTEKDKTLDVRIGILNNWFGTDFIIFYLITYIRYDKETKEVTFLRRDKFTKAQRSLIDVMITTIQELLL
jgi:hypothetical protein